MDFEDDSMSLGVFIVSEWVTLGNMYLFLKIKMYHKIIPSLQFTVRTTGVLFDLILLLYFLSSISQIPVLNDTNIVHYVLYPIRYTQQSQNNRTKSVIKSVFH